MKFHGLLEKKVEGRMSNKCGHFWKEPTSVPFVNARSLEAQRVLLHLPHEMPYRTEPTSSITKYLGNQSE